MYLFERKILGFCFFHHPSYIQCRKKYSIATKTPNPFLWPSDCKMLTVFSASRGHVHWRGCKSLERTTRRGSTTASRRIWVSDKIRNVSWLFPLCFYDLWRRVSLWSKPCSNICLYVCLYRKRLNELAQGLGPYSPDLESPQNCTDGKLV